MAYSKRGLLAPARYAFFDGTSLRYWLKNPDSELFVRGRGWITQKELRVGDRTCFGKVSRIGPLEEEGSLDSV